MIKSVTITNPRGETLALELSSPEKSGLFIRSIDGLGPPKATIDMSSYGAMDGSRFNDARAENRVLTFNLGFWPDYSVELMRRRTYRYFPLKKMVGVVIETDNGSFKASGVVELNEPDIFSKDSGTRIVLVCESAYLVDQEGEQIIFGTTTSLLQFPFSNESLSAKLLAFSGQTYSGTQVIDYEGQVDVGIVFKIHVNGPANGITITKNSVDVLSFDSSRVTSMIGGFQEGDDIYISTIKGQKKATVTRLGTEINIRNALGQNPAWLTIETGDNIFVYTATSGFSNLNFVMEYQKAYEGI